MSFHRRFFSVAVVCLVAGMLTGCLPPTAEGPTFAEMRPDASAPAEGMGRIYIYRALQGRGLIADVRLNGAVIGQGMTNGFFFVDRPPATYTISASDEDRYDLRLPLAAGDIRYVQLVPQFGILQWKLQPQLVTESKGQNDIGVRRYTGPQQP